MQVEQDVLNDAVIGIEAARPDQDAGQEATAVRHGPEPEAHRPPDQEERADDVEQAVAEDTPPLIGVPLEVVPLENLVEDCLVEEADDADADEDAGEQRRSATAHDIAG